MAISVFQSTWSPLDISFDLHSFVSTFTNLLQRIGPKNGSFTVSRESRFQVDLQAPAQHVGGLNLPNHTKQNPAIGFDTNPRAGLDLGFAEYRNGGVPHIHDDSATTIERGLEILNDRKLADQERRLSARRDNNPDMAYRRSLKAIESLRTGRAAAGDGDLDRAANWDVNCGEHLNYTTRDRLQQPENPESGWVRDLNAGVLSWPLHTGVVSRPGLFRALGWHGFYRDFRVISLNCRYYFRH
jgi:hypothetical protein